jgi:hypothetical protein
MPFLLAAFPPSNVVGDHDFCEMSPPCCRLWGRQEDPVSRETDDEASENGEEPGDGPVPRGPVAPVVRAGCSVLMIVGILSTIVAMGPLFAPKSTQCSISRSWIEDANDDKKTYNDVDTKGVKPDDLECEEAARLADRIPVNKKKTRTISVPTETALRVQGALAGLVGVGEAVAGFVTLRTLSRRARTTALVFAAMGILLRILGILSMAAMLFVLYALGFSAASRVLWPKPTRESPPSGDQ